MSQHPGRRRRAREALVACSAALIAAAAAIGVHAQAPAPAERLSFQDAIARAVEKNPSSAIAAAGILRAEALLTEARAGTRLQVNGTVSTTTLNTSVVFNDTTVSPRNSVTAGLDVRIPLFAAARWARRAQAADAVHVAELSTEEVHQQTALATADAYLTIIARRRVVEANVRARDVANAHFDLAHQLQQLGTGSRLNELRAQQELSTVDGALESAQLALYRAQEALGVLVVADGPVDAVDEPAFDVPLGASEAAILQFRPDLRFLSASAQASERVLRDSAKDYFPELQAVFLPQTLYPSNFFTPANSWRFQFQLAVPIFDSGQRKGQKLERQAALDISKASFAGALTGARSEVRAAREAVASAERGLASARAAADQAQQVVNITNISFRAGAATNIEVIDAERSARDADTAVAGAEDTLRRAKLELLTALGRFP
jgi:outer membrane protein TolC